MQTLTPTKTLKAIAVVVGLFVFQQLASKAGGVVANLFSYTRIDPDGQFMWISVHHIVQMMIALAAILILRRVWGMDFGLRVGNWRIGLRAFAWFIAVFSIYTVVGSVVRLLMNDIPRQYNALNTRNVLGTVGFQLLLSGTSEELLFRALPISVMWRVLGKGRPVCFGRTANSEFIPQSWKTVYPAGIVAAVLFAIAHINWSLSPFTIRYDIFQIIVSLVVGIVYAQVYERTESILYPMLMHGTANVVVVLLGYLCAALF